MNINAARIFEVGLNKSWYGFVFDKDSDTSDIKIKHVYFIIPAFQYFKWWQQQQGMKLIKKIGVVMLKG